MGLNFINFPSYGNYSHSITSSLYKGRNETALSNYQTKEHKTPFFENNKSLGYIAVTYNTSIHPHPPTTDSKIQNLCAKMPVFQI
jgi:hypothetical protein